MRNLQGVRNLAGTIRGGVCRHERRAGQLSGRETVSPQRAERVCKHDVSPGSDDSCPISYLLVRRCRNFGFHVHNYICVHLSVERLASTVKRDKHPAQVLYRSAVN
eukprot:6102547-Prymnesium_polylepis.2